MMDHFFFFFLAAFLAAFAIFAHPLSVQRTRLFWAKGACKKTIVLIHRIKKKNLSFFLVFQQFFTPCPDT